MPKISFTEFQMGRSRHQKAFYYHPVSSFTNCTKLINIVCKYGHGISFTILDRIYAINLIQDAQTDPNFVSVPEELVPTLQS